ncbi:MAG: phytoene/squalene synthase family protein [Proteobacteria bacterium]|nr:phytoene/squalene synthase family protein [Pseudomonadota bacterium]
MLPHWPERGFASPADLAACRAAIRTGSRSFHIASRLLPERVRGASISLYAFCRLADDTLDEGSDNGGRGSKKAALDRLSARLARIYAGRPADFPADRAFADVVARFAIPPALPEALLEGFAWDAESRRYATLADVEAYATRVAGSVGAMMTLIMGVRDASALARACDLGIAMQLTNIARDIGEDARAGRCYLPLAWLEDAGVDADRFLAAPAYTPAIAAVVRRLIEAAGAFYVRAAPGIAALPSDCRPAIHAARLLYADIGRIAAGPDFDPVARRAVVTGRRKAGLLARAVGGSLARRQPDTAPAAPSAAYLVEAAASLPPTPPPAPAPWLRLDHQLLWVCTLVERLRRAEQTAADPVGTG